MIVINDELSDSEKMNLLTLIALTLCLPTTVIRAQIQPNFNSTALIMDDSTFAGEIFADPTKSWLVMIGAKWCTYCRHLSEEVKLLTSTYPAELEALDVKVGIVYIDDSPGVASQFVITTVPAMYIINSHNGEVRTLDYSSNNPYNARLRREKYRRRDARALLDMLTDGVWRDMPVWSAYLTPWSLIGKLLGFLGRFAALIHVSIHL